MSNFQFALSNPPECIHDVTRVLARYFGALLIKNGFDPVTGMRTKGPSAVQ